MKHIAAAWDDLDNGNRTTEEIVQILIDKGVILPSVPSGGWPQPEESSPYWREERPTTQELFAHAQAHCVWGHTAQWAIMIIADQTVCAENILLNGEYNPFRGWTEDRLEEVLKWRPLSMLGDPVPWPQIIHTEEATT